MHFKVIVLCVFLSLVQYITAINKCNEDIIENILKMNGCPQSVLSKLHTFGDFKHVLVPETDTLNTLDYIHGCINEPIDGSSDATFTTGFSNKSLGPHTVNYHMEEHECGHVTDFHSSEYGGQTEIYFLSIGSTGCFYRCSIDGKEDSHQLVADFMKPLGFGFKLNRPQGPAKPQYLKKEYFKLCRTPNLPRTSKSQKKGIAYKAVIKHLLEVEIHCDASCYSITFTGTMPSTKIVKLHTKLVKPFPQINQTGLP
ncbi:hypothetical protein J6590_075433 [Homalodisca vitripennis]|nr:hypothetical protein J6590_075433 [Homalodisca vitripennis]